MDAWTREMGEVMGTAVTSHTSVYLVVEDVGANANKSGESSANATTAPPMNSNDSGVSGYIKIVCFSISRLRRRYKNRIRNIVCVTVSLLSLIAAIILAILYAIALQGKPVEICTSTECLTSAATLALSMDTSANPCEDFYQYVCGNWGSEHPRLDAYRSYNWFRNKQTKVYSIVRDFLTKNTSDQPKPVQQAKDMYNACVNTETLDERGLKPVITILESLGLPPYPSFMNVTEDFGYAAYNFNWLDAVIKIKTQIGMDVLIGFDIYTDPSNSSVYRILLGSPKTTNPFPSTPTVRKRRDGSKHFNYLKTFIRETTDLFYKVERRSDKSEDDYEKIARKFKTFYAELLKQFVTEFDGVKTSKLTEVDLEQNTIQTANEFFTMNNDIYELEADSSTSSDEAEYSNILEYTADEMQALTDKVVENNNGTASPIWKKYLEGVFNVSSTVLDFEKDKVMVSETDWKYMLMMAAYVAKAPPVMLELFIWMKVVEVMTAHSTTELRDLFQRAYYQSHSQETTVPRSLQCAKTVTDMLGLAVSYGIADSHFFNVTKPKIITMIDELKDALTHQVEQARWMDDNTKLATYQKIIEMKSLIGFPDWLLEEGKLEEYYDGIEVDVGKHLENMININQVKAKRVLNKFRERNNVTWASDPTQVNAYYTFQENTITVPMVMLQHPFFDLGLDSLNYGSLGMVLGHEIAHGFDNIGRQFDKNGNMLPWWSNSTINLFVNLTHCFVEQYSGYYVPELDKHLDGNKTLAENIADNCGLRQAFAALKYHLQKQGPELKLPGFEEMTSEQLFFLSFGNLWCGVSTKDSLKSDLEDEHSPQQFRARGALQNNEDFARAWHCPPGSAMNPAKQCIIF